MTMGFKVPVSPIYCHIDIQSIINIGIDINCKPQKLQLTVTNIHKKHDLIYEIYMYTVMNNMNYASVRKNILCSKSCDKINS